ncbi:hypothetical protein AALK14_14535 [Butyricimonas hominis]|uniref:hypothetical protein n=1 Tax=Butyricimonas TaxID=574697 RepID=UPI0035132ADA
MNRIIMIICFAWVLCGCSREMLLEDESLQMEEEVLMYEDVPFSFASILNLPSKGKDEDGNYRSKIPIFGGKSAWNLSYNEYKYLVWMADEGLFTKNSILRKLGNQLAQKKTNPVRLKFAVFPDFEKEFPGRDAVYDASSQTVLFKTESDIFLDRIILHEFWHVVQCELAGIKMTDKNEAHMEFEVMVLCDVIQTMITGNVVTSIKTYTYMSLVSRLVNLSGHIDPGGESQVLADYNKVYENWARENSISEPDNYNPGALFCFLSIF